MYLSGVLNLEKTKAVVSIAGGGGKTSTLYALGQELSKSTVLLTTTTKILKPENSDHFDIVIENNSTHFLNFLQRKLHKKHILCGSVSENYPDKLTAVDLSFIEDVKNYFDYVLIESDGSAGRPIKAPANHEPVISEHSNIYIGIIGLDCLEKDGSDYYVHRPDLFEKIRGKKKNEPIDDNDIIRLINSPVGLFKNIPPFCRPVVLLNKADQISLTQGKSLVNKIINERNFPCEVILNSYLQKESVLFYRK